MVIYLLFLLKYSFLICDITQITQKILQILLLNLLTITSKYFKKVNTQFTPKSTQTYLLSLPHIYLLK